MAPGWLRPKGVVPGGNIGEAPTNRGGPGQVDLDDSIEIVTIDY